MSKAESRDVYLDEPWLSIRWDEDHRCIHAAWTGRPDSVQLRSGTLEILRAIRDRHAASLLSDNRHLEMIVNQDQVWINESWTPMAVASGLKRIAVVLAPEGLVTTASEGIIRRFKDETFETHTFDSVEAALTWVASS
jgi:hypothetical protein